jgi:hypothetical protein
MENAFIFYEKYKGGTVVIPKKTYVEIEKILLNPDERSPHIPNDTKEIPFIMRVKGFLLKDAKIGNQVNIITMTKRIETGTLVNIKPSYQHTFGHFVDEVMKVRMDILSEMEDYHE